MPMQTVPSKRADTILLVGDDPATGSTISVDLTHAEALALARSIMEQVGSDEWAGVNACRELMHLMHVRYERHVSPIMFQMISEAGVQKVADDAASAYLADQRASWDADVEDVIEYGS